MTFLEPYVGTLRAVIVLAGAGAIFVTGMAVERDHLTAKHQAALIEQEQAATRALADAAERNAAILKEQQLKARKASESYEKALDDLRRSYSAAPGLRIPRAVCDYQPAGATASAGAGRPDEAGAGTVELPQRTADDLFALTRRADELAEQLRALQGWIRENGLYGNNAQEEAAR